MATDYTFEILQDTATPKLAVARSIVAPPFGQAVKRWLDRVKELAAGKAPKDTGNLGGNLRVVTSGDVNDIPASGAVQSTDPYVMFVHGGFTIPSQPRRRTRPHWPPNNASLSGWAERHGIPIGALQASIAQKGTPIVPFLSEAVDELLPELAAEMDQAGSEIVRRFDG